MVHVQISNRYFCIVQIFEMGTLSIVRHLCLVGPALELRQLLIVPVLFNLCLAWDFWGADDMLKHRDTFSRSKQRYRQPSKHANGEANKVMIDSDRWVVALKEWYLLDCETKIFCCRQRNQLLWIKGDHLYSWVVFMGGGRGRGKQTVFPKDVSSKQCWRLLLVVYDDIIIITFWNQTFGGSVDFGHWICNQSLPIPDVTLLFSQFPDDPYVSEILAMLCTHAGSWYEV